MTALAEWLAALEQEARTADRAEDAVRAEFAHRIALAADERAVAYRRNNLMRALAERIAPAESGDEAESTGLACLRARLGWDDGDEGPRAEVERAFAPVCAALFRAGARGEPVDQAPAAGTRDASSGRLMDGVPAPDPDEAASTGPAEALAVFEAWFAAERGTSFWVLFDNPMPETPRVDY